MTITVQDQGFLDGSSTDPCPPDAATTLTLTPETDAGDLMAIAARSELTRVVILFPHFADGRGFTLARLLRQAGYRGVLQAQGHVLADQYAMARRAGFDEVIIDPDLAARQGETQWRARSDWQAHDYQAKLRG